MALVVKNLPANAGDVRDVGSIPGWRRSPGVGNGNPLQYSAWRIPWTEEPGGLQSKESQRVRYDWATKHTPLRWRLAFGLRPSGSKIYVPKHYAPCFPQVPPAFKWHHQTSSTLAQNSIPFDSQPEGVPTPTNSRLWFQGWLNSASGRNKWSRF